MTIDSIPLIIEIHKITNKKKMMSLSFRQAKEHTEFLAPILHINKQIPNIEKEDRSFILDQTELLKETKNFF